MAREPAVKILVIRTDRPIAELYIFEVRGASSHRQVGVLRWQAHRQLADTIHTKIQEILDMLSVSLGQIGGIVCFKGPGSFTGLRIGLSVANAISYAQEVPIVTANSQAWIDDGIRYLIAGKDEKIATPQYDRQANTTPPKK